VVYTNVKITLFMQSRPLSSAA